MHAYIYIYIYMCIFAYVYIYIYICTCSTCTYVYHVLACRFLAEPQNSYGFGFVESRYRQSSGAVLFSSAHHVACAGRGSGSCGRAFSPCCFGRAARPTVGLLPCFEAGKAMGFRTDLFNTPALDCQAQATPIFLGPKQFDSIRSLSLAPGLFLAKPMNP